VSDARALSLEVAHAALAWPSPDEITRPRGAGASVFADLVRSKIGLALRQFSDARDAVIGVLMPDPGSTRTEPPVAVVVEFQGDASEATLRALQSLVWNFSHTPAVITLEPGLLRVWTCCEPPDESWLLDKYVVHKVGLTDLLETGIPILERRAALAVHWINLVSGAFFRERAKRFDRDRRADHMLLGNLRYLRDELVQAGLRSDNNDICHDLLARVVFVQFLFDRKDSDGTAALTSSKLEQMQADGTLQGLHKNFASILGDHGDTYALFDWLNGRFNGDLFPGKGDTPADREFGWAIEKKIVTEQHLALLADFIRGDIVMPTGQVCLWPQYSFDVIPLEFISSIYETFVRDQAAAEGIFYTPPYLVDFILDQVLPWESDAWDLTILDPACGSGIFLVKAFQRLVHRWKHANAGQPPRAGILRQLLERNLFGVDKDPHAVRVACFSLYLAMCDEIDPRYYWTQIKFPPMRERRLIASDFFAEDRNGFQTADNENRYDLVIGNAPWGERLLTDAARQWANGPSHKWPIANKGIGTLFLPKAASLLKPGGQVAMVQSASSLLFNRDGKAVRFRKKLFATFSVQEIVNLSALRFKVFRRKTRSVKQSVAPACIILLRFETPLPDDQITYISPKRIERYDDEFRIVIEPGDRRRLTVNDATDNEVIWSALMWGSRRDITLLKRLMTYPSLAAPGSDVEVRSREGVNFGDKSRSRPELRYRRILEGDEFPSGSPLYLNYDVLPLFGDRRTHSRDSTNFAAFGSPQLIIKQSWRKLASRFQARLVRPDNRDGVLCTQSYISVHGPSTLLDAACLSLNSMLATYFLLLTSGRFAAYRPEPLKKELMMVPVPPPRVGVLDGIKDETEIDPHVFDAFGLKDAEKTLVEDLCKYTLLDFQGDARSPGWRRTERSNAGVEEPQLTAYCKYFTRVLRAGFGHDKEVKATIFHDSIANMPFRLIAFELGQSAERQIVVEPFDLRALLEEFKRLDNQWRESTPSTGGIYQQRVARVYENRSGIPTVFILKPDFVRYWTRSAGLNDADEVALDLFRWHRAINDRKVVRR
jgi:N-6 DNA Methylase